MFRKLNMLHNHPKIKNVRFQKKPSALDIFSDDPDRGRASSDEPIKLTMSKYSKNASTCQ